MKVISKAKFKEIKEYINDPVALTQNFKIAPHAQYSMLIDFCMVLVEEIEAQGLGEDHQELELPF